ncbi:mannonate dehydratase [Oceanibium sediminis]|uniref:mannonate dehydratase n=1 Tax=Oceanibium sediminis TaxID=2026339 RepID=UPI000DD42656|nr:mannonate dehydratase [Oceanibium sediminis]
MRQVWRWFGPTDRVPIDFVEQAGAEGIVTALHHVPNGAVWSMEEIRKRQGVVAMRSDGTPSSLQWEVVESLPVSEEIKKQDGDWRAHIANYKHSLENLARAGLQTVCYNFMPVLDWTRTDLTHRRPNGARCMRFDLVDFAAFDICVLQRAGAAGDFPEALVEQARARNAAMSDAYRAALMANIVMGLPGANQNLSFDDFKALLASYDGIDAARLRRNLSDFLQEVVPLAEALGLRLCCHPDDPPFPLLGLPRIVSDEADYAALLAAADSPANGITLCSGSLGVNPACDLPGMMRRMGHRVHFLHLRNVLRESGTHPGSFHEAAHLEGHTDMVALISAVLEEEARRRAAGRQDCDIPMRPDHGQELADDLTRGGQPGYPLVGRLRGLAELRGIVTALSARP